MIYILDSDCTLDCSERHLQVLPYLDMTMCCVFCCCCCCCCCCFAFLIDTIFKVYFKLLAFATCETGVDRL